MSTDIVGEYRLLQALGEGAAGQVYLATPVRDKEFARAGEPLALKLYKPQILRQPKQIERIRREFRVGSGLSHPNLVRIHELCGLHEERPYLVMEYIDGITLDAWLQMFHPVSGALLLRIVEQLLAGLGELHRAEIIHRDLKPANIMISSSFDAKIMDYGVVHVRADSEITPEDKFLGTIRNSSPELLFGQAYDQRTDLYSLGTVIYALLYGEEIFAEESQFARLTQLVRDAAPSYSAHPTNRDQVCSPLLEVTKALLQKDLDARPTTVQDVQTRLAPLRELLARSTDLEPLHGYIGTALTGLEADARGYMTFASSKIAEVAKQHGLYVYQPRKKTDPLLHKDVEPAAVYTQDRRRVVSADLLLVLLNKPSFGVGQELEIAASYGKPTLLIVEEGTTISRMVTGSPANIVDQITYSTPEDLEKKLHKALDRAIEQVRLWKQGATRGQTDVGPKLRELRERAGYTSPEELARAVGMSPRLMALVETGEFENLGIRVLERISAALDTSVAGLIGPIGSPVARREVDPNLRRLEDVAKKLNWPASEFFSLRDDYNRQLAARGEAESISDEQWLLRRNALEQRTLADTQSSRRPMSDQPGLFESEARP